MVPPRPEFTPVGKRVESSKPLELDYHAQHELIHDMKLTGKELESSSTAIPVFRKVVMSRIPLLDERGQTKSDKLWVNFSEDNEGRQNAIIQLSRGAIATQFHLAPTLDKWYVSSQSRTPSDQKLSNSDLVAVIASKLPDTHSHALDAILDSPVNNGMVIPHLLHDNLFSTIPDRNREKQIFYTSNEHTLRGATLMAMDSYGETYIAPEYLASVNNYFSITEKLGKFTHDLVTRAPYDIDGIRVEKEYAYKANTTKYYFGISSGRVAMSSIDGMSRARVDSYVAHDQEQNEPIYSLHRGLDTIRTGHGLRKIAP